MMLGKSVMLALFAGASLATQAAAQPAAAPPLPLAQPVAQTGQALVTVNAPVQLLGIPVRVTAPNPITYTGSAYRDDISGQSESNSDAAIAESARGSAADRFDAW